MLFVTTVAKRTPVKPVGESSQYPYKFFARRIQRKSVEGKYEEQPRIAVDGTKHAVRTADNFFSPKINVNTD